MPDDSMTTRRAALIVLGASVLLSACATATYVPVHSSPSSARIFVDGVDTRKVTPAEVDLEEFSPDPDSPMTIELRLDGHRTTRSLPYPARHRCDLPVCEKKMRRRLPCLLALERDGTGVRVDALGDGYEVALDEGPWLALTDGGAFPQTVGGIALAAAAGPHRLRWRRNHGRTGRGAQILEERTTELTVPADGWVAVVLNRLP